MKKVCRLGILCKIFAEETNTKNNENGFSVLKMRSDMLMQLCQTKKLSLCLKSQISTKSNPQIFC